MAASGGLSSECTFEAMLERREKDPTVVASVHLDTVLEPAKDQAPSALVVDGVVSLVSGGVIWRDDPYGGGCCGISYRASTSRTCCEWSPAFDVRFGDDGHCTDDWPDAKGEPAGPCQPCSRMSADVCRRPRPAADAADECIDEREYGGGGGGGGPCDRSDPGE